VARAPAIELAPGVVRIPTLGAASINSYAFVEDDGSVTLVDCGLKRAPARIVAGLRAIGRHPGDVRRIVLTHAHADHAGGAADLAARTGAPVAAHETDATYVERGEIPPYDPSLRAGRLMTRLSRGGFPPVAVGERLTDGQVLDVAGGLRVVATPGHTPGHISLLHEPTATLITGDAVLNQLGLRYSFRFSCTDFRRNDRSAHVLGELEYDRVGFTHGREITRGAREAVRRILRTERDG
jgi:glyoxylase-like metal-dependent hydrolase (beta-lactamase superfamily II)